MMALLDLLGRRWTLRILWELRDGSAPTFRELRDRLGALAPLDLWAREWGKRAAGGVRGAKDEADAP